MTKIKVIESKTKGAPEYLFSLNKLTSMVNADDSIYIQLLKRVCTIVNGKGNFEI